MGWLLAVVAVIGWYNERRLNGGAWVYRVWPKDERGWYFKRFRGRQVGDGD